MEEKISVVKFLMFSKVSLAPISMSCNAAKKPPAILLVSATLAMFSSLSTCKSASLAVCL